MIISIIIKTGILPTVKKPFNLNKKNYEKYITYNVDFIFNKLFWAGNYW